MTPKRLLFYISILIIAVFLRVWRLDQSPVELFGDEIDVTIQANSLLYTGRDYLGHPLPISLTSFSESRLPFLMYTTVPFVKIFGLNEYGARMSSVLIGLCALVLFFCLSYRLYGRRVGTLVLVLGAFSPWWIHFSRWTNDNIGILVLATPAIYFFIRRKYVWSAILFALTFYTYSVSTIFIPLLVIGLFVIYHPHIRQLFVPAIAGLIILSLFIYSVVKDVGSNRFAQISIFSDSSLNHDLVTRRSNTPSPWVKYFRNKPVFYAQEFLNDYLRSFSTEFLFFNGDPILRHSAGGMGMLYYFEIITLPLGVAWVVLNWRRKSARLIFWWLLIAPVSSALTKDGGNHAGRLIVMLPPLVCLSALGMRFLVNRKLLFVSILILAAFNFAFFIYRYHVEWPRDSWRFWQYGYKEALAYLKDKNYSRVYLNNTYETALPRFLFWYNYSPETFQKQYPDAISTNNIVPGFSGFSLGNRYFFGTINQKIKDEGFAKLLKPGEAYLASFRDEIGTDDWTTSPMKNVEVVKIIKSPTGESLFAVIIAK